MGVTAIPFSASVIAIALKYAKIAENISAKLVSTFIWITDSTKKMKKEKEI